MTKQNFFPEMSSYHKGCVNIDVHGLFHTLKSLHNLFQFLYALYMMANIIQYYTAKWVYTYILYVYIIL